MACGAWYFDYGPTIAYGATTPEQTAGEGAEPVSATVTGLTPATVYYFRFRTQTIDGLSEWSAPVSIIAH